MPERNASADSFDKFFVGSKNENNTDDGKKANRNDTSATPLASALIKAQPMVHHRQSPSEKKSYLSNRKTPLTTYIRNTSTTKTKSNESSLSKKPESDLDDNENSTILPPIKQSTSDTSHSKSRKPFPMTNNHNNNTNLTPRRRDRFLPSIRTRPRTKRLQKRSKNELEQRLLSAEHEKISELQSRLTALTRQLERERMENKTLRILQDRDEKTLKRYEDQEIEINTAARDYSNEIDDIKKELVQEKNIKTKLEKEIENRDEILRDQVKRMKYYEKLVYEPNLHEPEHIREKLQETEGTLKNYEEKIAKKEKYIQSLEKTYRQEIHQELVKERDIKHEIEIENKKYNDLLQRFEAKSRQIGSMHIYIQQGGRRPSKSVLVSLSKSRSLQSLPDLTSHFREKILEYDRKRREEERFKPKPKPKPIVLNPLPKPERKKYVPPALPKPKVIKAPPPPPVHEEKPPKVVETEYFAPKISPPRRFSAPRTIVEDKREIEDLFSRRKSASPPPSPIPPKPVQPLPEVQVRKRTPTPVSSPDEPKSATGGSRTGSSIFKDPEPTPPITRESNDKWLDIFETKQDDDEKKVIPTTKPSLPSSQRPSMIMFEPATIVTNGHQKKPPTRLSTTNVYEFDQNVLNLHEGKPVRTQSKTKPNLDPTDALFNSNSTNSFHQMSARDDTFTTTKDENEQLESLFTQSSAAPNSTTVIKSNLRRNTPPNDKMQRPKVVTNTPKSIPNRTDVEEIEEIVL